MDEKATAAMSGTPGIGRPVRVAIIGSTRFKEYHLGMMQRETLLGKIVLSAGFFHHRDMVPISDSDKRRLDDLAAEKVRLSDEVLVVNVHGYVGETTKRLIGLAKELKLPVRWMEPNSD
jgi:hypothetical protein